MGYRNLKPVEKDICLVSPNHRRAIGQRLISGSPLFQKTLRVVRSTVLCLVFIWDNVRDQVDSLLWRHSCYHHIKLTLITEAPRVSRDDCLRRQEVPRGRSYGSIILDKNFRSRPRADGCMRASGGKAPGIFRQTSLGNPKNYLSYSEGYKGSLLRICATLIPSMLSIFAISSKSVRRYALGSFGCSALSSP
jgi:hypothetical protein